jgi:hypothetical protein
VVSSKGGQQPFAVLQQELPEGQQVEGDSQQAAVQQ